MRQTGLSCLNFSLLLSMWVGLFCSRFLGLFADGGDNGGGDNGGAPVCEEFPCLIFEDNFDTLNHDYWEHEKTLGGGGVRQTK